MHQTFFWQEMENKPRCIKFTLVMFVPPQPQSDDAAAKHNTKKWLPSSLVGL
jgi:hypothetical protein